MTKNTEYLVTHHSSNGTIVREVRAPTSVNIRFLLERFICQCLSDEDMINSCLRSNANGYRDPFQIIDMRDDFHRDFARTALQNDPETENPIGTYEIARRASIPIGTTVMVAGRFREFFVQVVEAGDQLDGGYNTSRYSN